MNNPRIFTKASNLATTLRALSIQLEDSRYQEEHAPPHSKNPERDLHVAYTKVISFLETENMPISAQMLLKTYEARMETGSLQSRYVDRFGDHNDDSVTELLDCLSALMEQTGIAELERIKSIVPPTSGQLFEFLWPNVGTPKRMSDFLESIGDKDFPSVQSKSMGRVKRYASDFKTKIKEGFSHSYRIVCTEKHGEGWVTLEKKSK